MVAHLKGWELRKWVVVSSQWCAVFLVWESLKDITRRVCLLAILSGEGTGVWTWFFEVILRAV